MKKEDLTYFAISNEELAKKELVGRTILHRLCGCEHEVKCADKVNEDGTKTPDKSLGFVDCGSKIYLVAIDGKEL